jgi:hypothetical protein
MLGTARRARRENGQTAWKAAKSLGALTHTCALLRAPLEGLRQTTICSQSFWQLGSTVTYLEPTAPLPGAYKQDRTTGIYILARAYSDQHSCRREGGVTTWTRAATCPFINEVALTSTISTSLLNDLESSPKKQKTSVLRWRSRLTLRTSGLSECTHLTDSHQYANHGHCGQQKTSSRMSVHGYSFHVQDL